MAVTSAAGLGRPRGWLAGLAWVLWALAMLGLAVGPWMDRLLRQAGPTWPRLSRTLSLAPWWRC